MESRKMVQIKLFVGQETICGAGIETHREGNGTPLQYSCLENPMDRGAW